MECPEYTFVHIYNIIICRQTDFLHAIPGLGLSESFVGRHASETADPYRIIEELEHNMKVDMIP